MVFRTGSRPMNTRLYQRLTLAFLFFLAPAGSGFPAVSQVEPALRVLRSSDAGVSLLANGDFEDPQGKEPAVWRGWHQGFDWAPGQGRNGSQAVSCARQESTGERGVYQTFTLERTQIAPLVVRAWSKADSVSGSADSGYSLYTDIIYADGTPVWGRHAAFSIGSHDWEMRELFILPDKPVRSISVYCLFRGHTGRVHFDDVSLREIPLPAGTSLYQGALVPGASESSIKPARGGRTVTTQDGLALTVRDQVPTRLRVGGQDVTFRSPAGFLARDYAASSDFFAFQQGRCAGLGLRLDARFRTEAKAIVVEGQVQMDGVRTNFSDRAITLVFALPVDATGWTWGDDLRTGRRIDGKGEWINAIDVKAGANGKMSRYPLAAIWEGRIGLALGVDMEQPSQYRLVYHAGQKQLLVAYDFGLAPETRPIPGGAAFRFVIYRFDPAWGFRAALQRFYEVFPQHFAKRSQREGVWMPFTDIARVPGFEDFGFAFQEGAPNVAFDDAHQIASFVYVEPMSHWLPMPVEVPRTYQGAMAVLQGDLAGQRSAELRRMAAATLSSGVQNVDGRFGHYLQKAPWCDGGVFFLNPLPGIATNAASPATKYTAMRDAIDAAFARHAPPRASAQADAGLDGVYLDSLEMAAEELNYRRDHFGASRVPLVFDAQGRVCQMTMFNTWEFARDTALSMHRQGKLLFANGALWKYSFPAAQLDVLGTEVNWLREGRYEPDSDAVMNQRRALSFQKPYCLLLNTDYAQFGTVMVEKFFQRCLFYGIWPGFFDQEAASKDPYWTSARKWYERDRPAFKKYIPLLREITAAGWQPITGARSDNPRLWLERFGPGAGDRDYLTVLNDTDVSQTGMITLEAKVFKASPGGKFRSLLHSSQLEGSGPSWSITLGPQQAELLVWERVP